MRPLLALLLLTPFILTNSAQAQMEDPILTLPDGQVILNISATERKEVEQDLLVADLAYMAKNKDTRELQNEINLAMTNAVKVAKKAQDVKVITGYYQVYENVDPRSNDKFWQGSQSLTLKSKNAESLLKLVAELQDLKLTMNSLSYMLDPETAVEIQDSLMEAALKQLQERADRAAKAMGKSKAELRDVNVQGSDYYGVPMPYARGGMMMAKAESMDMAAPVAEAGDTTLTMTVSARAILKP